MGVRTRLVVYARDEEQALRACRAAYRRIAQIDRIASDYLKSSELNHVAASAATQPVRVSDELWDMMTESIRLSRLSDGAYDMTAGPYIQLWRAARKSGVMPAPQDLAAAAPKVGYQKIQMDATSRTVKLAVPGMKLDLGAKAKGYAGDQAIAVLREHGVTSALYEAGGDIVVSDAPPGTQGWRISFDHPGPDMPEVLLIHNAAISTSGDTEQYVEIDGKRYSHIIDARTGIGLTTRAMATVLTTRGLYSDGLSATATLLGPEKTRSLIQNFPSAKAWVRIIE